MIAPSLVYGLFPTLFEMLLPIQGPGPPVIIDVSFVAEDQLCRPTVRAIDNRALDSAFDERISRVGIESGRLIPLRDHLKRLFESLRIVESLFYEQTVAIRPQHLDDLK